MTPTPIKRRRWYTDDELDAVQVIKTDRDDGAYWVIVAGDLVGTVEPRSRRLLTVPPPLDTQQLGQHLRRFTARHGFAPRGVHRAGRAELHRHPAVLPGRFPQHADHLIQVRH
ncbi:hypothetical protein [Nonomuraea sp. NPDC049141]|uniref:hypothetical protein n=1 Tax=Nonomuraea sp. NPDC049141 TaxID=3155500 RepID=UPI0033D41CE6